MPKPAPFIIGSSSSGMLCMREIGNADTRPCKFDPQCTYGSTARYLFFFVPSTSRAALYSIWTNARKRRLVVMWVVLYYNVGREEMDYSFYACAWLCVFDRISNCGMNCKFCKFMQSAPINVLQCRVYSSQLYIFPYFLNIFTAQLKKGLSYI